jgi:type I restriction enzyme S subunit
MAGEWSEYALDDCMAAIIDYRGKTPRKTSSGIPLVTAKVVKRGRIEPPDEFIAVEDYELWMRRGTPRFGDVVITTEAPLGEVAQLGPERVALAQRLIALRGKKELLDNRFLKFLLQSENIQNQLRARASGTTVLGIKQSELRKVILRLPSMEEQRTIAHILGTLDDKIELNRWMNETLEGIARALFKSWFVDFDPVRAKAEGRDTGLPREIADLFPAEFRRSDFGYIPEGWQASQLADLLIESNERIGDMQAPEYSSTNNGLQLRSERFNKTLAISSAKNKLIRGGYLVFGLSRRVLNFGLMRDELGSVSSAYTVFKVREEILCSDLLERLMRLKPTYFYMAVSASSREGQSISSEGLNLLRVVVPPRGIQDAFYSFDTRFTERIAAIEAESRTLAALRDELMPNLISGDLRVKNAGRILEMSST